MTKVIISIVITLCLLCGCGGPSDESTPESKPTTQSVIIDSEESVITEMYDASANLIQRTEYNKITKITIITNYYWYKNGWGHSYIGSSITIIDSEGNIISSTESRNALVMIK